MTEQEMTPAMITRRYTSRTHADNPGPSIKCILQSWILMVLLLTTLPDVWADTVLRGRVISISGTNTLKVLDAQQREHKIRLAYIETPELAQPFGDEAQSALAALVLNREISAHPRGNAADGALPAEVITFNGKNVNVELLSRGLAWHEYFDRQSAADRQRYQAALLDAQRERRGMWGLDRVEAPKDFRARRAQLLRWWLYAIAAFGALLVLSALVAHHRIRIEAWLAEEDKQRNSREEQYRQARAAAERDQAERDRMREIANREMDRLAENRRNRM